MADTPTLQMLQLHPDLSALLRFLAGQGQYHDADGDLGYGVHAWLAATFGHLAPRPFRLYLDGKQRKPPKLLAYTPHSREILLAHARSFAEPAAQAVCVLDDSLTMAALPEPAHWLPGRRLGFEVLACPVARRSRDGVERDVFLHQADRAAQDAGLDRAMVYRDWLAARLLPAAVLESCELDGFQLVQQFRQGGRSAGTRASCERDGFHLVQQFRQGRRAGGARARARLIRPAALLRGVLVIQDGERFHALIGGGIGRHGAFGYGMLLLRPV